MLPDVKSLGGLKLTDTYGLTKSIVALSIKVKLETLSIPNTGQLASLPK